MVAQHVGIIGEGMIGMSWAAMFTGNGIRVTMVALCKEEGKKRYKSYYDDLVSLGLVSEKQARICEKFLTFAENYDDLKDEDLIFECVSENLNLKHSIYKKIEASCKNFKAIASATSALSPEDLALGLDAREKIVVAHPWNPPHLVPCVELVKNDFTDPLTVSLVKDTLEYAGREVALMNKPARGFIANRLQHALFREAVYMVEKGICTAKDVDNALRTSFAPRYTSIGLFEHFDYVGLDMIKSIDDYLFQDLCNATKTQDLINSLCEKGEIGFKTGRGVYNWKEKNIAEFRKKAAEPYLKFFNWKLPQE